MIVCLGLSSALQHILSTRAPFDAALSASLEAQTGQGVTVDDVQWCAAGKSVNAAKVAHALGATVHVITLLGGASGQIVRRDLERPRLTLDAVRTQHPTRICSTILNSDTSEATECVQETEPTTPDELAEMMQCLDRALPSASVLVLSGSLAPGTPTDFYAVCVDRANACGVRTIIDVQGGPLHAALPHHPTVVKPNRAELARTVGMPTETQAQTQKAICELVRQGARWVCVTAGERHAILGDGQTFMAFSPPSVRVVNPIGSGDAFAGAMAVAMANGWSMPQAMRWALAAGSSNASHLQPGQIDPDQVGQLANQVTIPVISTAGSDLKNGPSASA